MKLKKNPDAVYPLLTTANFFEVDILYSHLSNYHQVSTFIAKSINRIKQNLKCELRKKIVDDHIRNHDLEMITYYNINIQNGNSLLVISKNSYYQVLKEEELLHKILKIFE